MNIVLLLALGVSIILHLYTPLLTLPRKLRRHCFTNYSYAKRVRFLTGRIGHWTKAQEGTQQCCDFLPPMTKLIDGRTLTVLWILRTVIYTDIGVSTSGSCRTFHDIQLPASKDLWEATTNSEWVTRYQAYIKARKGSEPLKVGALFAAQQPNSDLDHDESQAEDLHGWSSTTDDFGSLLIMAIR